MMLDDAGPPHPKRYESRSFQKYAIAQIHNPDNHSSSSSSLDGLSWFIMVYHGLSLFIDVIMAYHDITPKNHS